MKQFGNCRTNYSKRFYPDAPRIAGVHTPNYSCKRRFPLCLPPSHHVNNTLATRSSTALGTSIAAPTNPRLVIRIPQGPHHLRAGAPQKPNCNQS